MSTPDSPSKSKKLLNPIKNIFNSISQSNLFNKTSPNQGRHERLPSPPPANPFADPVPNQNNTTTANNHSPNPNNANENNNNQQSEFSYEEMLSYEQHVKESEANLSPLVSFDEPLTALLNEYAEGDPIFLIKIQNLSESFPRFRRCRGDGNCFYRAFGFSLFEYLSTADAATHDSFMENVKQTKELLIEAGFEWIAIQDFYETFVEELEKVHPSKRNTDKEQDSGQPIALTELVTSFQTDYQSNAIVVYLRFITSAFLKVNSENYLPFIISDGYENMDQFCVSQVEAIGRESDEIHIIAISKALQLQVTVAYLDGRPNLTGGNDEGDESLMMANLYNFPDPDYKSPFVPPIYLLYRPGHYDILYSSP